MTIEKIPPLGVEYGARARSARSGNPLYFPNIPEKSYKYRKLMSFQKRLSEIFGLAAFLLSHQ